MTTWDAETLSSITTTDDLLISPFRDDGKTYGTPTWIWSVVVDGELYVRPWNGVNSRWHRSAMAQEAGRIRAAGETYEVRFDPAGPEVNDAVDAAYRAKYASSSYLPPMVAAGPQAATTRIRPV